MAHSSFQVNASKATARAVMVPTISASSATMTARTLPSPRHGSQAYFWTREWQQKERLADFDFLIGDTYRPSGIEDLIRELESDDDE
jgi:hypothetical protein